MTRPAPSNVRREWSVSADESDELLRRCQGGDASALSRLIALYKDRLFRLSFRVLGDAVRAEEATADVLLKVWDRCRQWRGEAAAGTWIYRVALRTILDHARRRPSIAATADRADDRPGPLGDLLEQERLRLLAERLWAALAQLSAADRALLHLYYFEDRALADLETILDAGRDALKMRLMRARQRLRPFLEGCDGLLERDSG
jgi:RNA polymerase sigma-70 factor (ECF subfamily)